MTKYFLFVVEGRPGEPIRSLAHHGSLSECAGIQRQIDRPVWRERIRPKRYRIVRDLRDL